MSSEREARDARQGALSDGLFQHARAAIEGDLPSAALQWCAEEDVNAAIDSLIERLDGDGLALVSIDRVADFLLSYSADGDEANPWQDGHNYAMREAARMVRERWFEMGAVAGEPHFRDDGPNGETTGCDCPKGIDHD